MSSSIAYIENKIKWNKTRIFNTRFRVAHLSLICVVNLLKDKNIKISNKKIREKKCIK